jgi:hypothetical protein
MMWMMDAEILSTISVSSLVELVKQIEQDEMVSVSLFSMVKINPNHRN